MYCKAIKPHRLNLSLGYFSNFFKKRSLSHARGPRLLKEEQPRLIGKFPIRVDGPFSKNSKIISNSANLSVLFSTNIYSFSETNKVHGLNCGCTMVPNETEILNNDSELRSYLDDIMKDFDSTAPSPPGKKAKIVDDTIELSNGKVSSDDVTSSKDLNEKTTDGKLNFQSSDDEPVSSGKISLDELVDFLHAENLKDLAVIKVPEHLAYSDYLVLVTAFSFRQLKAVAENICKNYKSKNRYFQVEGKDCKDWKVIDMGSIVLHIFISDVRDRYDLETLWTVGEQFDELANQQQSDIETLLGKHTYSVSELKLALNNVV